MLAPFDFSIGYLTDLDCTSEEVRSEKTSRFINNNIVDCIFVVILDGEGVAELNGEKYSLQRFDLSLVPLGVPHRFLNQSGAPFTMMYVYPTTEVTRDPVDHTGETI